MRGKSKALTAQFLFVFLSWSLGVNAQSNPHNVEIDDGEIHFNVTVPSGWRIQKSTTNYCLLYPERKQEGSHQSTIAIGIQPTEGKIASRLFDNDELVETASGKQALIRPYRIGSIPLQTDLKCPGAVAYITEGAKFIIINLGSDDQHYLEDQRALKEIVKSFRKAT